MAAGWMKGFLSEGAKLIGAFMPIVTNDDAVATLWIKLAQWRRLTFVIMVGDRAGATTPEITLQQATSNAGAGAKALAFDQAWGVSAIAQTADKDTLAALTVASDAVALPAADATIVVIEVRAGQLDINNGFKFVNLNIATAGANDVPIAVLAIAYDGDHAGKQTTLPSTLA